VTRRYRSLALARSLGRSVAEGGRRTVAEGGRRTVTDRPTDDDRRRPTTTTTTTDVDDDDDDDERAIPTGHERSRLVRVPGRGAIYPETNGISGDLKTRGRTRRADGRDAMRGRCGCAGETRER